MAKQYSTTTVSFFDFIDILEVDTTDLWCEALDLESVPYTIIDSPVHTLSDGTNIICRTRMAGLWRPGMVREDVVNVLRENATRYWKSDPDDTAKMVYVYSSTINITGFRNGVIRSDIVSEKRETTNDSGEVVPMPDYIQPNIGYVIFTRFALEWKKK